MTVMVTATCPQCLIRLSRVGLRTGDEHNSACASPVVVDRAWSTVVSNASLATVGLRSRASRAGAAVAQRAG